MESKEFSFGSDSVASSYDNRLVPILFDPWANRLIREHGPWDGLHVLDLATGTGIVAAKLADAVGASGMVYGADMNPQMLALAQKRCADVPTKMEFIECPAESLDMPSDSVDVVVCQQGFQFFPDKVAAAREVARVLRQNGKVAATMWLPVTECEFFGVVCDALTAIGESDICNMMRAPFDLVSGEHLADCMDKAGLKNVRVSYQKDDFVLEGGFDEALEVVYATPIGPKLKALSPELQSRFRQELIPRLQKLSHDGITMGCMAASLVSAEKVT